VTASDNQRAPVIGELLSMFTPLELDARVQSELPVA
jgi:hypothetical protein